MADNAQVEKRGVRVPVSAIVVSLAAIVGVGAFLFLEQQSRRPAPAPPPLTPEAKAYVKYLRLSDVERMKHESYLKQSVVEIVGKIGNAGDRPLMLVEINCVFYDPYGQVVLRERVPIVGRKTGGLAPGETKSFRLAFDSIPESWNQAMPQMVIAQIVFG